jgi:hypothetical protein
VDSWSGVLSLLGPASIAITLAVLGLLSRRLGGVTHAKPYYRGFYVAAFLVAVSVPLRLMALSSGQPDSALHFLYNALIATGVTIGVVVAWRYWSWLLAERD